jgi:hypothetical protein
LKAFESDVRAHLRDLTPQEPQLKKQRLLDSDSEAEVDSQDSSSSSLPQNGSRLAARPRPSRKVAGVGFTKVTLDGLEIEVGFNKGPGMQLPANAATLRSVLAFLHYKYDILLAAGRDINVKQIAARKGGPHELLDRVPPAECRGQSSTACVVPDRDTNRIRFRFDRGAFMLMYMRGGSLQRVSKGFEVPRTDVMGNVMPRGEYAKVKTRILHKARMAWNDLDDSDAPRFKDEP